MPSYDAPIKDMQFLLHEVLKVTEAGVPGYDEMDESFTGAVLDEAGKIAVAQYNVKATGHVAKLRRDLSV